MEQLYHLFVDTIKRAEQEGKDDDIIAGIWRLMQDIKVYYEKGFMEKLLFQIAKKKLYFLMTAKTKAEVKEILRPSVPVYNGNAFVPNGPFHVDEEELVLWSVASIKAPLNHEGFLRYYQLFKEIVKGQ